MESSSLSLSVEHQHFQLFKLLASICRKGCRRRTVKKELPPNQNRWWIWYREGWQGLQQRQVRLHLQARVSLRANSHGLGLIACAGKPVATSTEKPRCYRFKQRWRCVELSREADRGKIDNWHGETLCRGFGPRNWFGDTARIRDFCRINSTHGKSTHRIAK